MVLSDDFYYQPIKLDTINTQVYTELLAKEGDAGGRGLKVTLTENGVVKNTTGIDLNLKWEHTSIAELQGLEPFDPVDLTKGIYKVKYPTNMLKSGTIKAFIQIIDNGGLAGSRNIKITVDSTVGDDAAIESGNEFAALAEALIKTNRVEGLLNEAIANVTVDSEVITARNSTAKGKTFTVIDERFEEMENDVYFPAENILPNGDFEDTSGWVTNGGALSVYQGDGIVTISELGEHLGVYTIPTTVTGHEYYITSEIYPKFASNLRIGFDDAYDVVTSGIIANTWNRRSVIKTKNASSAVIFYHKTDDGNYVVGDKFNFRRMMAIDLTETFGAGFEPSVEQMDRIMSQFDAKWFIGIGNLSQPALLLAKTLDMEAQFTAAINGVTEGSETINARVGEDSTTHATLKARLDSEKSTIDQSLDSLGQQLAQAEAQIDLLNRGLGETFAVLVDLQTAYPTGDTKDHIVGADGHRYFWNETTVAWEDGGAYQAVELTDGIVSLPKLNSDIASFTETDGSVNVLDLVNHFYADKKFDSSGQMVVDATVNCVLFPVKAGHIYYFGWLGSNLANYAARTVLNVVTFDTSMTMVTFGTSVITNIAVTQDGYLGLNTGATDIVTQLAMVLRDTQFVTSWTPANYIDYIASEKIYKLKSSILDVAIPTKTTDLIDDRNPWRGKDALFYGTSITAQSNIDLNAGYVGHVNQALEFGSCLARGIGGQTYFWNENTFYANADGSYAGRYGSGGLTSPPVGTTEHKGAACSWDRIKTMIPSAIRASIDLIFVEHGTNDLLNAEEMTGNGSIEYTKPVWSSANVTDTDWVNDTTYFNGGDYNVSLFSGAIASTIMKLTVWCPNAVIIVGTPLPRWSTTQFAQTVNSVGKDMVDVAEAEIKTSHYLSIPAINVNGETGINKFNYTTYISDGVHPANDSAKKLLAKPIIGGLQVIPPRLV